MNVAVLTTGFDAPHVDLIAILRPTESVSLYQQIVGSRPASGAGENRLPDSRLCRKSSRSYAPEVARRRARAITSPYRYSVRPVAFANTFWGKTTADGTLIEHFGRRCRAGLKMTTVIVNSAIFVFVLKLSAVQCGK